MPIRNRTRLAVGACVGAPLVLLAGLAVVEPPLHPGESRPGPAEVVGVLHVHTVASDGAGSVEEVTAAAREQELDFVLLTDHNVWGAPEWTYTDSVLLIVGEEVNTPHGHLLVAGGGHVGDRHRRPSQTPSGTATAPAVRPEEGLRIAAHPTGRTPWTGWEGDEFDGIEIWNADTERRGDSVTDWMLAVGLLPFRPMAGLYRLLDQPRAELALWDRLLQERPTFGVCGVDAHNTLPLNREGTLDLHFPAYRHSFAMARQHVFLPTAPTGDPEEDGRTILAAIAAGRSYCAFDGLAGARGARFTVRSGPDTGSLGDTLEWAPDARLDVALPEVAAEGLDVETVVVRDGQALSQAAPRDGARVVELPGAGVYRIEVMLHRRGRVVPWILTNPFWLVGDDSSRR